MNKCFLIHKLLLRISIFILLISSSANVAAQCTYLTNTDFETSAVNPTSNTIASQNVLVPPWRTTASDGQIELWRSGFQSVPAYSGNQFVELNANVVSTLFQNFTATAGSTFTLNFAHRGRSGTDVMNVSIGTPSPTSATVGSTSVLNLGNFSDGNTAWGYYNVTFTLPTGSANVFSIRFTSVSSAGGNASVGNFLDAISIADVAPSLSSSTSTTISCPASTANLTSFTATNTPGSSSQTWHTGPMATEANRITSLTAVPAGTYYSAYYNSVKGCYGATQSVVITQAGVPVAPTAAATAQPTCNLPTGTITVAAPLSTSYTYSINGTTYQPSTVFAGVSSGTYQIRVRNGTSSVCTSTPTSVTISASPLTPTTPTASVTSQPSCTVATGTITVSAPAGTGITYSVNGTDYQSSTVFTGVSPGTYAVTVRNLSGCTSAATSLTVNAQPSINATLSSATICSGTSTTLIATNSSTGTSNYQFGTGLTNTTGVLVISPTASSPYSVTVTSAQGCRATASTIVTVNPAITATITASSTTLCQGQSATLTAEGGSAYSWSTTETTASIVVSTSGVYSVTISNTQGCSATVSTTITVNPVPQLTINSSTICAGRSTTLTVGGCSTGTLLWSTGANTTSLLISPLINDVYSVTCTLATTCSAATSTTVVVNTAPSFQAIPTSIPASCTGSVASNNAQIVFTTLQNTERADISPGSIYSGAAYGAGSNLLVSNNTVRFAGLANPASTQLYTVRLFGAGGGCFIDVPVRLATADCQCLNCVPAAVQKAR
ncbi:hypothetical protein [Spirosoma pomorum]